MGRGTQQIPELIIFDLDGTIIDTEPTSIRAWIAAAGEYGLDLTEEQVLQFIGLNNPAIKVLAKDEFGADLPFDEIFLRKQELSRQEFDRGITLKTGAKEVLETVKELGIPACIATSSSKDRSERFLQRVGLWEYFEFLISGQDVTQSKPDPEIFLKCLEKAGVKPDSAMVVEDSKNGISGARRSGATTVLIPDVVKVDETMLENADFQFVSLLELRDYLLSLI